MPALQKPAEPIGITLPPRRATLAGNTDVLVVGGGPAGFGAAMGAAAAGARVILAERYGFLGGAATASLVMPWMSFHTQGAPSHRAGKPRLLPDDHGEGEPVVAGALQLLLERLIRAGGAVAPIAECGYVVPFDPELLKLVAEQLLEEVGVELLYHSLASQALVTDGQVTGLVFETKSGPLVIEAGAVVDCTGDGDVAASAGAPYEVGRVADGRVQPMSQLFRLAEVQRDAFEQYIEANPHLWHGVHGLAELIAEAKAAGLLDVPRDDVLMFATPHPGEVSVNSTRVGAPEGLLGIDVWDLTRAESRGRKQVHQIARLLKEKVPGFAHSYVVQSGTHIGVRETRRILGEYQLTAADLLDGRTFPDVIARNAYPLDIHDPLSGKTMLRRLPPGLAYDIPLRCLLPLGVDNLLVAGRCISGTHEAHSSYRVFPAAMAIGHAAGVCAALAVRGTTAPRAVPFEHVQGELIRQGAHLGI